MAKIGYIRVSKYEQNEALQKDALKHCDKIFIDLGISGSKEKRPGLDKALSYMREGDQFIVWKLDRAGRSLPNLISLLVALEEKGVQFVSLTEQLDTSTPGGKLLFHVMAALAQFERDLMIERTTAGLEAARARGRVGGRPKKLKENKIEHAKKLYKEGKLSINEICDIIGVVRSTLYRYLNSQ